MWPARSLLAGCVAVLAVAALWPREAARPVGREIRVAIGSDLRSTEPGVNRDAFTDDMMNHVVEGLVAYRADLSVGLVLAASVKRSPDGLSYIFGIRPGVHFHNGQPLTADEVKWSLDRALAHSTKLMCKSWYDGSEGHQIAGVDVLDRLTVRIRLGRPDALFLTKLANFQCLMGIVHPNSVAADGTWRSPIGTGPYRIDEHRIGQYVTMTRFAHYVPSPEPASGYAGRRIAMADRLKWIVVPDPAAARAALVSGQVDLAYNIDAADLPSLRSNRSLKVHVTDSLDWNALLIQTKRPLLSDLNLRLAIGHAIDLPGLAKATSFGISKANPSAVPRSSPYFTAVQEQGYGFDLRLARSLLARSSYRGQPIRITTNRRFQHMYDEALTVQAMLRKAGINAELDVTDWTTQLSRYFAGDFDLMVTGFSARADPALAYMTYVGDGAQNAWVQWSAPAARLLVEQISQETDRAKRQKLLDDLHRLQIAEAPIYDLSNHYVIQATSPRIDGYRAWSTNKVRLWNVQVRGEEGR